MMSPPLLPTKTDRPIYKALALVLSWSLLTIGCAVTDKELNLALEQSRAKAPQKRGDTELHVAVARGDISTSSNLIKRGADLNAVNDNGQTALMQAIRQDQTAVARLLIEQGAKIDIADEEGNTALHLAIQNGQLDVVQTLLAKGADPNRSNKAKDAPLLLATRADYPEIALQLLKRTARPDVVDRYDLGPLHYAVNWRKTDLVKALIERGLSPNLKSPNGQMPLMIAAYNGDTKTTNLLIEKGAQIDLQADDGWTSLHMAAQNGHMPVVAILLDRGADMNTQTKSGHTSALLAAENDHSDVVRHVVSRGIQFAPLAENGRTTFASALVAQAMAEAAQSKGDSVKARDHHKVAAEWFDKAAATYQDLADTADTKILMKGIAKWVWATVAITRNILWAPEILQHAKYETMRLAQMAASRDAALRGTGQYGYFSQVVKYEQAFQTTALTSPINNPNASALIATPSYRQDDAKLEELRALYRKLAQQARDLRQWNMARSAPS